MTSQPAAKGWDFGSVFDLIDSSDVHDVGSPKLENRTPIVKPSFAPPDGGIRLGSFVKLFEDLGIADDLPLPPLSLSPSGPESSGVSNAGDVLLPSPRFEYNANLSEPTTGTDDTQAVLTKKQRKRARQQAEKEQQQKLEEEKIQVQKHQTKGPFREAQRKQLQKQIESIFGARPATVATAAPILLPGTVDVEQTPSKKPRSRSSSKELRSESPTKSASTKYPTKAPQPASPVKQLRPQSRPNVGAKVRPATLVPVVEPVPVISPQKKDPQTPAPGKSQRPAVEQRVNSAQIATPQLQPASTEPRTTRPVTPTALEYGASHGLVPRTVRPTTVSRSSQPAVVAQPSTPTPAPVTGPTPARTFTTPYKALESITIRPSVERHIHFHTKLLDTFPGDAKYIVAPRQLVNEKTMAEGIHIFVDASNIMIGFKDLLRKYGVRQYDMAFDSLALLLERRRPVAKRVFAGSHREANPLPQIKKLVETSKAVGYESILQEQVFISRDDSEKKKFFDDVKRLGWHKAQQLRSGSGSDSETGPAAPKTPSAPRWVEQGVDEILHLKMCQSIIDTDVPSTMVLATGDGNVAEMSDGFLAHVERALKRGWKVELISWRQQTNGGYRNKKFRLKWGQQFKIIELDEFVEDLIDTV
ncbi:uncharacterized protein M421DRAFT_417617 [Didymella exigua CBS 183.55]|uniref:NYN domain-containing protein n=1 Tax=Didymella exigua CBS 183.55 TaxID=1150837 RepID=A0A6A5RXC8_9PLEO|nr:uncharacterized protein M421DRAFT_417617 [Didymella exigua CBS 183.55]KAF1931874.1 hypothetical protein M421DRAFT_417617 [Didymella exigua CBS 183.55]